MRTRTPYEAFMQNNSIDDFPPSSERTKEYPILKKFYSFDADWKKEFLPIAIFFTESFGKWNKKFLSQHLSEEHLKRNGELINFEYIISKIISDKGKNLSTCPQSVFSFTPSQTQKTIFRFLGNIDQLKVPKKTYPKVFAKRISYFLAIGADKRTVISTVRSLENLMEQWKNSPENSWEVIKSYVNSDQLISLIASFFGSQFSDCRTIVTNFEKNIVKDVKNLDIFCAAAKTQSTAISNRESFISGLRIYLFKSDQSQNFNSTI